MTARFPKKKNRDDLRGFYSSLNVISFSCGAAAQRGPWHPHSRGF